MRWRVESSVAMLAQHEIHSRLILDKAEPASNGIYECEAQALEPTSAGNTGELQLQSVQSANSASRQQQQLASGDKLQRFFGLLVNGK